MITSLFLCAGLASQALAACSRAMLQNITAAYLQAQAAGKPSLLPLAATVSYLENDKATNMTASLLSQPLTADFSRSLHDTSECSTFTELTAASSPHPWVIHTRMLLSPASNTITTIQSVAAHAGDWEFNATAHLFYDRTESWPPIPEGKRDARAVIKAAADAYLDSWSSSAVNATAPPPFAVPCTRLEGGTYTAERLPPTNNTCTMPPFPEHFVVGNRRYVVDEEVGGVEIMHDFPWLEITRPKGTPSSNLFRVEGGRIKYIHENTVCATVSCGRVRPDRRRGV